MFDMGYNIIRLFESSCISSIQTTPPYPVSPRRLLLGATRLECKEMLQSAALLGRPMWLLQKGSNYE